MIALYWIIGIIFLIATVIFLMGTIDKKRIVRRKNDILSLFISACESKKITDFTMEYVNMSTHDFYFESEKNIYYIKIIFNSSYHEICINNAIKWQLRKFNVSNEKEQFVDGIEPLMRLDLTNQTKKEHKLFIIYPNITAILKVINECEMVFIYPNTDVYGSQVITYKKLKENPDLLEL